MIKFSYNVLANKHLEVKNDEDLIDFIIDQVDGNIYNLDQIVLKLKHFLGGLRKRFKTVKYRMVYNSLKLIRHWNRYIHWIIFQI